MSKLGAALLLVAALAAPAAADGTPRDIVVAASPLARLTDDSMEGRRWDDVPSLLQAEKTCQAQIDAALAGGMRMDQEFELPYVGPTDRMPHTRGVPGGEPHYWSNLGLMRGFCKGKLPTVQLLEARLLLGEAYHDLQQLKNFSSGSAYQIRLAAGRQRACAREVKRALDMGNAPGISTGLALEEDQSATSFERKEMKLGDAQAKVCEPLAAQVDKARQAAKKGQNLSKYAALPGDRKKVFEEQGLWLDPVFGEGKTPLEAPEDYQYAGTWYVVLMDRNDSGGASWILRSFRFEGDKLADSKETRGDGQEPPAESFK